MNECCHASVLLAGIQWLLNKVTGCHLSQKALGWHDTVGVLS